MDDNKKGIGKKVKKVKKRIKELDNKVTKEKSKDRWQKEEKKEKTWRQQQVRLIDAEKNGKKKNNIEVNKISRHQMRAKEIKVK